MRLKIKSYLQIGMRSTSILDLDLLDSMPASDYTAAAGGSLKLKGVQGSKVAKAKKKKKRQPQAEDLSQIADTNDGGASASKEDAVSSRKDTRKDQADVIASRDEEESLPNEGKEVQLGSRKTEAERRHEEQRRKRVRVSILDFTMPIASTLNMLQLTSGPCLLAGREIEARRHQDPQGEG